MIRWSRRRLPPSAFVRSDRAPVAYIANLFPNLTETFVYREVESMRRLGQPIVTISIRRPARTDVSAEALVHLDDTIYILPLGLLELLGAHFATALRSPRRYFGILRELLSGGYASFGDRLRTLCHFAEGIAIAPVLRALGVRHIHAHFAVGSATCAWVASHVLDLPFSMTAHAYDIWRDRLLLPEKLAAASFTVACTQYSQRHLQSLCPAARDRVQLVYHGIDLARFAPERHRTGERVRLLAVGRLVEQKGYPTLLRACARLIAQGRAVECVIAGDGPLRATLEAEAAALGVASHVRFLGRVFQDAMPRLYAEADIFVLACQRASDGDMDGIPNVLWEAMASALPVVSTSISGIPEAIEHERSGLLVVPEDFEAFAGAVDRLLGDPALRDSMGRAARQRALGWASLESSAQRLLGYIDRVAGAGDGEVAGVPALRKVS